MLTLEDKIAFLQQPGNYPEEPSKIETIETHMSWVFIGDNYVYKMKKPVFTELVDYRTLQARYLNCVTEIKLNRRLAENVYIDLMTLKINKSGHYFISPQEITEPSEVIDDWFVLMRRLPEDKMLDYLISQQQLKEQDIKHLAEHLAKFYMTCPPAIISQQKYYDQFKNSIESSFLKLSEKNYPLSLSLLKKIKQLQISFLYQAKELFDARVMQHKIIEGHGDLRPEHVCLEDPPVVIDCLEFNQELRTLDAADDLAYLSLECEFLGNTQVGELLFQTYQANNHDTLSDALIAFYKSYKACLRAWLSIRHLDEPRYQKETKWQKKANKYLELAEYYVTKF